MHDHDGSARVSELLEIAALERPLTAVERLEAGIDDEPAEATLRELWETACFERPLLACERQLLRRQGGRPPRR